MRLVKLLNDPSLEFAKHYVGVRVTQLGVQERFWKMSHDLKTIPLPKPDSTLIGADYKVELHSPKVSATSTLQRMGTHRARDSMASGC